MGKLKEDGVLSGKVLVDIVLADQVSTMAEMAQNMDDKNPERANNALLTAEEKFYKLAFGEEIDLTGLEIPPKPEEKEGVQYWLIVTVKGMGLKEIVKKNRTGCKIKVDPGIVLETAEIISPDSLYKTTAVWVVNSELPDLKDLSSGLMRRPLESISQRLIHGIKYFLFAGNYLENFTRTITSSRVKLGAKSYSLGVCFKPGTEFVYLEKNNTVCGGRQIVSAVERKPFKPLQPL